MQTQLENKNRKLYQKPQVERVRLLVEEAVLANCKQSGQSGPYYSPCQFDASGGICSAQGS